MNLIRAEVKAKYLVKELESFCDQIEIVGKIRRRKDSIDKIEILLAPKGASLFGLMYKITEMGGEGGMKVASKKTILLKDGLEEVLADLWFTTIEKWSVTLLLKTGGVRSNQRIAKLCSGKNWQLSIGEGAIYDEKGKKLPIKEEKDIFDLLEIPFIEPSLRE